MDTLNPVSAWPALVAFSLAFFTAWLLVRRFGAPPLSGRFATIDGLRGYLAFGVFMHHACIWYFYQHTGSWQVPPSHLYTHLGQSGVALFFMITGFLFFSKLIAGRERPIDWLKLFVSRLFRLVPLYLFVMVGVFVIVAVLSNWTLHEPAFHVFKEAVHWLLFTIVNDPLINDVVQTHFITAGVTWSLPYEWFFYGALPLLALTVGVVPRWPYLLLAVVSTAYLFSWHALAIHLWPFAGGIVAAWACRSPALCRWASGHVASGIVIGTLALAVIRYPNAQWYPPLALLSVAFVLIACGNSLFGLLLHPASRMLGEMAYSIYLLHGMLLFVLLHFILGADKPGAALAAGTHWTWILALSPVVVLVSYATFRLIEAPAMRAVPAATCVVRRWFQKSPNTLAA